MEAELEPPNPSSSSSFPGMDKCVGPPSPSASDYQDDFGDDYSNSSTPFVSAPSSPGRSFQNYPPGVGFFYSAPTSPMHYVLASAPATTLSPSTTSDAGGSGSFEFEFSARFDSPAPEISADELFLNGQIRPMKLSAHLQRPQKLAPLIDLAEDDDDVEADVFQRARDLKLRDRSLRRRTRSLSPLRSTTPFDWLSLSTPNNEASAEMDINENGDGKNKEEEAETTPSGSGSSSRCSSAGRSSKRWVFLKDFLRSKSEGSGGSNNKFWHKYNISSKDKKSSDRGPAATTSFLPRKPPAKDFPPKKSANGKAPAGNGKRRSAHEMHYTMNRAQAEEMRKKTFLPYRQGLLGCLGFNSKSYGALNGFARALNPVSST